jgi:putative ABC transport system permease protein
VRIDAPGGAADLARARTLLPQSSRTATLFNGPEDLRVPGRRLRALALAARPEALADDGLAAGMVVVTDGRLPRDSTEVALSPGLARGLAVGLGGTVGLGDGSTRRVAGTVVIPESIDQPLVVRVPSAHDGPGSHALLVALPAGDQGARTLAALRAAKLPVTTRADASRNDGAVELVVALLGAVGFFEAALVIATAFAVGLRRRQRDLGLLGSLGAPAPEVAFVLTASAGIVAAAGAVLGTAVGLGVAYALHPQLDGWNRRLNGPFEIAPEFVVGAIVGGVLTALVAAAVPAMHAARMPVRVALGGRRPAEAPSRAWIAAGAAMLLAALALIASLRRFDPVVAASSVVGAALLAVLGFGALSPWLLERAARLAGLLPPAWRLAVRDAGRFRARHGPVITAVLAAMAMSVTVATLVASLDAKVRSKPARMRDDVLVVEGPAAETVARRIARSFPSVAVAPLEAVFSGEAPIVVEANAGDAEMRRPRWVAVGGDTLLRVLGAERGIEALRAGRFVVLDPPAGRGDWRVRVGRGGPDQRGAEVTRVEVAQNVAEPAVVLAPERLQALGLAAAAPRRAHLVSWLVRLASPVNDRTLERARAIALEEPETVVDAAIVDRLPSVMLPRVLLAICAFTGLVIVLVATALSGVESAADERVLRTVGASPALLRAHAAARAGYLAFLGSVLAVPAGLIVAAGLIANAQVGLPFVPPWLDVALALVVLPLASYAVAWRFGSFARSMRAARG